MVKHGRIPKRERERADERILQALEMHPDGLGVRELRMEMGKGSFQTICRHLDGLQKERKVAFREANVGRGRPKKIFTLSRKGIAHMLEFRILKYFEEVRESCKENERFEIDNYALSYAVYGLPKNLDKEERDAARSILAKVNSALLELDDFRGRVINKEAYAARTLYHKVMAKIHSKIRQYVSDQNMDKELVVIDAELQRELDSCIPSLIKDTMRLSEKADFALVATRGPSFIDEYSLRPENYLLDMVQAVESWDDDGIDSVVRELARNKYVDQEVIERLEKWDIKDGSISNFDWQKIKERLAHIPKIREEMKKDKDRFIQSGNFKQVVGLNEGKTMVVTKEMLGKKKLDKLRKELSALNHA
jgi:DNA-binding PadR family transcriptional regulator